MRRLEEERETWKGKIEGRKEKEDKQEKKNMESKKLEDLEGGKETGRGRKEEGGSEGENERRFVC